MFVNAAKDMDKSPMQQKAKKGHFAAELRRVCLSMMI